MNFLGLFHKNLFRASQPTYSKTNLFILKSLFPYLCGTVSVLKAYGVLRTKFNLLSSFPNSSKLGGFDTGGRADLENQNKNSHRACVASNNRFQGVQRYRLFVVCTVQYRKAVCTVLKRFRYSRML